MRALVIAMLLLAPIALAQSDADASAWTQLAGDAQRSRTARLLDDAPLDVVAQGSFLEAGESVRSGTTLTAVETPHGVVLVTDWALVSDQNTVPCTILRIPDLEAPRVERHASEPCPEGAWSLLGYHAGAKLVLVGRTGAADEVTLDALDDATLEPRWRAPAPPGLPRGPAVSTQNAWRVRAVLEDDRIVAVFTSRVAESVLAAYTLDGSLIWSTPVSTRYLVQLPNADPSLTPTPGFAAETIVGIETGYVLFSRQQTLEGAMWFDRSGKQVSGWMEHFTDSELATRPERFDTLAVPPVGQGESAVFMASGQIVVMRATDLVATVTPSSVAPSGDPLVWWREHLAVPVDRGITLLRSPTFDDAWTWKPAKPFLTDLVVTPDGQLVVMTEVSAPDGREYELSWIDITSRVETRRLPLPRVATPLLGNLGGALIALSEGRLLAISNTGTYFLLARADEALVPSVSTDDAYPPPARPVRLAARPPGTAVLRVSWGDGTFDSLDDATVEHVYATPGSRVARVTAIYPDGRTATREVVVHVGGTPPVQLNAVQRAFSDENQELTFFLLGLAFTGGGLLFAALLRRRRQSHLARETRRLHELQDLAARDPVAGLDALEAHRRHLEGAHVRRRLDDAHYAHLDARTIRAMRATRLRLLGETVNQLTPHFRGLLDTALEDGRISPGELATLISALAKERIEPTEGERLRALLGGWAR